MKNNNPFLLILSALVGLLFITGTPAQDFWQNSHGPEGGNVSAIVKTINGSLFAAAGGNRIYRIINNGYSWQPLLDNSAPGHVNALATNSAGQIFAANSHGVYRSDDNGNTWSLFTNGLQNSNLVSLCIIEPDTLLAGSYGDGVFRSEDNGQNWVSSNQGLNFSENDQINCFAVGYKGKIFAALSNSGVILSDDNGRSWYSPWYPPGMENINQLYKAGNDTMYAATADSGIFRSKDGNNWEKIIGNLPSEKVNTLTADGQGTFLAGLQEPPFIVKSTDGCKNWEKLNTSLPFYNPVQCLIRKQPGEIIGGSWGDGFFTYSNSNVNFSNNGFFSTDVLKLAFLNSNKLFVATGSSGLFVSPDSGASWQKRFRNNYPACNLATLAIDPKNHVIYISVVGMGIFRSFDGGETWIQVDDGLPSGTTFMSLAVDTLNNLVYTGADNGQGVYKMPLASGSWTRISNGLSLQQYEYIFSLVVDADGIVYAGGSSSGVYRSVNKGYSWEQINQGLSDTSILGLSIDVHNRIYAATHNGGICFSEDKGDHWLPFNNGLTSASVSYVAGNRQGRLFAATPLGVYQWNGPDRSWQTVNTNRPVLNVHSLTFDNDGFLYAGLIGGSVYKSTESTLYNNEIIFKLDMHIADKRGIFNVDNGDGVLLFGNNPAIKNGFVLTDNDYDYVFEGKIPFDAVPGDTIRYHYAISRIGAPAENENLPQPRILPITGQPQELNTVFFNNDNGSNPFERAYAGALSNDSLPSRGAIWFDANQDDRPELFTTTANGGTNAFYLNNNNTFPRLTANTLGQDGADSRGATVGDFNNDGLPDVFVANAGNSANLLYQNMGSNNFTLIDTTVLTSDIGNSRSACWVDYDKDGFLDLFVTNFGEGRLNWLYRNLGHGSFEKITDVPVASASDGNSMGCVWADFDNSNTADLFVANAGGENNFYFINGGDGTFTKITTGVIVSDGADSRGCSAADFDNDGDLDLFVTNYAGKNLLYVNNGNGHFTQQTNGLLVTEICNSVGSVWADFNNDGWLDLFIANEGLNELFMNNANGTFTKINSGSLMLDAGISVGCATADYDLDGKTDLFVANADGHNFLYHNIDINENNWIKIKLIGTLSNKSAIGTRVYAYAKISGVSIRQMREVSAQSGLFGQSDLLVSFGLGNAAIVDSIKIIWPSGQTSDTTAVMGNDLITMQENKAPSQNNLPEVRTDEATDVQSTTAILNGAVNAHGKETWVKFQYGSTTVYGSEIDAQNNPATGDSFTTVTAKLTGLTPGSTYHFRVAAVNLTGETYGEDHAFTTGAPVTMPDAQTLDATYTGVRTAVLSGQVNPHGLFTIVEFEYGPTPSFGQADTAAESPISNNMLTHVSLLINGLEASSTYYFRVKAVNNNGTAYGDTLSFTTNGYPETHTIQHTTEMPVHPNTADYASSDYRLFGIPGRSYVQLNEIMDGEAHKDWMAYWDNGQDADFMQPYILGDLFRFGNGRAFWVVSKNVISVNKQINSSLLNDNGQTKIPLHPGWNLITNPFIKTLSWNAVQTVNDISEPLWAYNGSFNQISTFEPYKGYYFFNTQNKTILYIPYDQGTAALSKTPIAGNTGWTMDIRLVRNEKLSGEISIGQQNKAKDGYDRFDYHQPHTLDGTGGGIYFYRPQWNENFPLFASDMRGTENAAQSWDFTVSANGSQKIVLSSEAVNNIGDHLELYLLDQTNGRYQNLKEKSTYPIPAGNQKTQLKIILGTQAEIQNEIRKIVPRNFALKANYPNPFNPQTTIPLQLAAETQIELSVFNILGQKVAQIFSGHLQAGNYFFNWNATGSYGKRLPSGVYFCRLSIKGKPLFTNKMVLMK